MIYGVYEQDSGALLCESMDMQGAQLSAVYYRELEIACYVAPLPQ